VRHAPFWFLELCRPVLWLLARLLFRVRFVGAEHVPTTGPVLITPNHVTFMDPILVSIPIHRPLHYLALEPFLRIPGLGWLMRWCRAWPVHEGAASPEAARLAARILRAGQPLVVFPEGGRAADGRLQAFQSGAFRLALATGAPVVPVTLVGAFECWPVGQRLPRPGRVTITYHAPVGRTDVGLAGSRAEQAERLAALVRGRVAGVLPRSAVT
jgi:1-acyl-sn-glycerol-3-phosphate acyltransferase